METMIARKQKEATEENELRHGTVTIWIEEKGYRLVRDNVSGVESFFHHTAADATSASGNLNVKPGVAVQYALEKRVVKKDNLPKLYAINVAWDGGAQFTHKVPKFHPMRSRGQDTCTPLLEREDKDEIKRGGGQ